jgi:hypothetical protein
VASRRSRICPSSHAVTPRVRAVAFLHPSAVAQSPSPSKTTRLRPSHRFSPCLSRPPGAVGGACGLGCANGAPQGNDRYGSWLGCDSPFPCIHEPFRRHRHSITRHRESQRQIRFRTRASDACLLLAQFVASDACLQTGFVPSRLCTPLDYLGFSQGSHGAIDHRFGSCASTCLGIFLDRRPAVHFDRTLRRLVAPVRLVKR